MAHIATVGDCPGSRGAIQATENFLGGIATQRAGRIRKHRTLRGAQLISLGRQREFGLHPFIILWSDEGAKKMVGGERRSAPDPLALPIDLTLTAGLLTLPLDMATNGAAGDCTTHGGQLAARAAPNLVTDQAANDRAGRGASHTIGVAGIVDR